jgi:hypothetical protein
LISEVGLDEPFRVIQGMLMAAAPASILALRIGKMGLSSRRIWWTGIGGMWLPLSVSVTLLSLAKMCGARLYWKPSLPIEFFYAFAWLFQGTDAPVRAVPLAVALWPLSLTILGPSIICATWIKDMTSGWVRGWQKLLAFAGVGVAAYLLMSDFTWALYYQCWLWSIVVATVVIALTRLRLRRNHATSNARPQ